MTVEVLWQWFPLIITLYELPFTFSDFGNMQMTQCLSDAPPIYMTVGNQKEWQEPI